MKKTLVAETDFAGALIAKKLHLAGDATKVSDYYMLNTTDSVYSRIIPMEYQKVGSPLPYA